MDKLRDLIEQSRHWASADRGLTLFRLVAEFFQHTLAIDAGLFIYKKQFILDVKYPKFQVYHPWGLNHSSVDLNAYLERESPFNDDAELRFPERWIPIDEIPDRWRRVWEESEIRFVGSWPLIVKERVVGGVVVGHKSSPIRTDENLMSLCSTYISFVAEMLSLRRVAEFHSKHEPLTGLLNRRGFEEQFGRLSSNALSNRSLMIGIVDINDFKSINDHHGHIKGDMVLQDVASILKEYTDNIGICARFGGDEFVFAVQTSGDDIETATLDIASLFSDKEYSVSIGWAIWNKDGSDWASCFDVADKRLYNGKTLDTM